jgi:serine/threonine-protein kinase
LARFIYLWRRAHRKIERVGATATEHAPLPKSGVINHFTVGQLIADGGTATVYMGADPQSKAVAIKVPHLNMLTDRQFVNSFRHEATVGLELQHPSIVKVLDVGSYIESGLSVPYFVMEYLDGEDLRTVLDREKTLNADLVTEIGRVVADALEWAHRRGVTHRDISPQNIFLTRNKMIKVTDFGISAISTRKGKDEQGVALGTPEYMAPERIRDPQSADPRSDLYALGCVMYEMLAGKPPFVEDDVRALVKMHLEKPVPPLPGTVTRDLASIVMRLLEKDPKKRYQDARLVTSDLADLRRSV